VTIEEAYQLGYKAYQDKKSCFLNNPFKGNDNPVDIEYIYGRHWVDGHVQAIKDE
jgi:hypothetical protein